ncbi:hypothetical protein INS49_004220 [Diaporthe citri]|uniref:uncharacterized protein n=1 Tax=Diaporthe citri TaxID=83186 RepID=UPI001C81F6D2|nr:uncharacterized protein INS49_004220 [Diaporthe citri]KAG6355139.1 hypothetical protein INS49_004220 [Diaporthe citri]
MAASNETLLYRNPLNSTSDVASWVPEGPVNVTAVEGALELSGGGGIDDHFVFWAPEVFPDRVRITWEFSPRNEPGLAIFFFAAESVSGGSIFDPGLAPRNGSYPQYHSSDIRTLHVSYFRRRWPEERAFLLSNLRKSPGFNLVAQGADPLPPVVDAAGAFYRITVIKDGRDGLASVGYPTFWYWYFMNDDDVATIMDAHVDSAFTLTYTDDPDYIQKYFSPVGEYKKWLLGDRIAPWQKYLGPEDKATFQFILAVSGGFDGPIKSYKSLMRDVNAADEEDIPPTAANITQPVLLITATDDRVALADAKVNNTAPYADQLRVTPVKAGHFLLVEQPQQVNEELRRFVDDVRRNTSQFY